MATLNISGLSKSYGSKQVIPPLDLEVEDGEFVALVGPSGCGKSTLLRLIAGLDDLNSGAVQIDGHDLTAAGPKQRNVAMVFQNYALYPHMTVAQNIGFGLRLAGVPQAERKRIIDETAEMLGLGELLDRFPGQLSGGQRQRVAMGRAVVRNPSLFLFDEPLSNLDAELRVKMRGEIKALHRRLKTTTIYVTHDQIEAMTMADRIVVLREGRILQQGAPIELFERPQNKFVAGFIGSPAMNFLEGQVVGKSIIIGSEKQIPMPKRFVEKVSEGEAVTIGIRPQYIALNNDPDGVQALVTQTEPTGTETMIVAEVVGREIVLVVSGYQTPEIGSVIGLSFDQSQMHLFDSKGDAISV